VSIQENLVNKLLRVPYILHSIVRPADGTVRQTVLFLHGIGNSSTAWSQVVDRLPTDVRVIRIDLLGFGKSPKPKWVTYDARI
jgi:pimeloyl-ACP methyl ester carboxylesterase